MTEDNSTPEDAERRDTSASDSERLQCQQCGETAWNNAEGHGRVHCSSCGWHPRKGRRDEIRRLFE